MHRSDRRSSSVRTFPAEPSSLAQVRAFVRGLAVEADLPDRIAEDLVLAVSEACANTVLHSGSPDVEVRWTLHEDRVEIEVRDRGHFQRRVRLPSVDGPGGFGIPLMAALAEGLVIEEGTRRRPGTLVRLVKRRDPEA
jgi:anti-sigma regulatory factor (Ser/Thr protein kinase)